MCVHAWHTSAVSSLQSPPDKEGSGDVFSWAPAAQHPACRFSETPLPSTVQMHSWRYLDLQRKVIQGSMDTHKQTYRSELLGVPIAEEGCQGSGWPSSAGLDILKVTKKIIQNLYLTPLFFMSNLRFVQNYSITLSSSFHVLSPLMWLLPVQLVYHGALIQSATSTGEPINPPGLRPARLWWVKDEPWRMSLWVFSVTCSHQLSLPTGGSVTLRVSQLVWLGLEEDFCAFFSPRTELLGLQRWRKVADSLGLYPGMRWGWTLNNG